MKRVEDKVVVVTGADPSFCLRFDIRKAQILKLSTHKRRG